MWRKRERPSSCDLDTLCYGDSWRVLSPPCLLRFQTTTTEYDTLQYNNVEWTHQKKKKCRVREWEGWNLVSLSLGLWARGCVAVGPCAFWESNDFPPLFSTSNLVFSLFFMVHFCTPKFIFIQSCSFFFFFLFLFFILIFWSQKWGNPSL